MLSVPSIQLIKVQTYFSTNSFTQLPNPRPSQAL